MLAAVDSALPVLFLSILFGSSLGRDCSEGVCLGDRPRTSSGCCPALKDQGCGPENSLLLQCDAGLGYRCLDGRGRDAAEEGTCQGRYNLTACNVTETTVWLSWEDFKPADYQHEYSLLRSENRYHDNLSDWNRIQCGAEPWFKYSNLEPDTWYFFKVGVWLDPFRKIYANLSETLMVKTDAVEYCSHNGVEYEVGHTFDNNCEQRCTCMENGQFNCTDLCEEQEFPDPQDRVGCEIVRGEGEDCCRLQLVCEHEPCNVSGTIYRHGAEFQIGCKTCQCNDGRESCAYPENCSRPETGSQCPHPQEIPIAGECCPQWSCGNITCRYHGVVHQYGEVWLDEERCQRCSCRDEVVCDDICVEPVVPDNCTSPVVKRDPAGCCNVVECLPPVNSCLYEETMHLPGDYFPNSRCELCVCTSNSSVDCSPRCKPVIPPAPSPLCPNPHVRTDGCCETLWCDNPDLKSIIRDLFGTSYSPHSVTLSFNVAAKQRAPLARSFEILYVSSENITTNLTHGWHKTTFTPEYVHSEDEPLISPTQLLQTSGAIRVDRRIYVTISGMKADTTYFFKIRAVRSEEPDDETVGVDFGFAGAIAVKTLATDEPLACTERCPSAEVIMVPSASCPKPVLVQDNNTCCPEWKCFPKDSGCRYKNLVLQHGEQIREGCDKRCRCDNGKITCSSVCPEMDHTPRPGCALEMLADHCCPLWMCTPLTHSVRTVSLSFMVTFAGRCSEPVTVFRNSFSRAVLDFVKHRPVCSTRSPQRHELCDTMEVKVKCPISGSVTTRQRRSTGDMTVDLHLVLTVSDNENMTKTKSKLEEVVGEFASVFNESVVSLTVEGTTFVSTGLAEVIGPLYDCDQGYVFVRNICVEAEIAQTQNTIRLNVSLSTVEVSTDSAILKWDPLDINVISYVTGLQIEYKEKHYSSWNQSRPMERHVTRHTLTRLHAARTYKARLVLLMDMEKNNRVSVSMLEFMTKSYGLSPLGMKIDLQEISVSATSVSITWTPLSPRMLRLISAMQVTYREDSATRERNKQITPIGATCVLDGLVPGTNYAARVEVLFKNGSVARSSSVHFVTGSGNTPQSVLIPLVVSAVVVVCAIAIVLVTCCLWRRAKLAQSRDTSFENKTFGIHMENDGKVLSAKP